MVQFFKCFLELLFVSYKKAIKIAWTSMFSKPLLQVCMRACVCELQQSSASHPRWDWVSAEALCAGGTALVPTAEGAPGFRSDGIPSACRCAGVFWCPDITISMNVHSQQYPVADTAGECRENFIPRMFLLWLIKQSKFWALQGILNIDTTIQKLFMTYILVFL